MDDGWVSLEGFLSESVGAGASDIYLSAGLPPAMRLDGEVLISELPVLRPEIIKNFLDKILPLDRVGIFESTKECDFSFNLIKCARFRVNVLWQERGLTLVFRVINQDLPNLEALASPEIIKKILSRSSGLVLVVGATGSGKSTTLAAMIGFLNENYRYNIITIEDPIEFVHAPCRSVINQRELHRHTLSFANALRAALREDPDCVLVGELRDLETIRLALTAAETGHLILATLHTNSAAHTLDRVVDVFPAGEKMLVRTMLSESLNAVICQRLVRKIGGGRTAAWEVMICTPAIRNLIREGKTAQIHSTIQTSQSQGMMTMEASLRDLVRRRLITEAECQGMLG